MHSKLDQPVAGAEKRLSGVDALRGLASFAVCYYHLTLSLPPGRLRDSGSFGWLGVQVFFVISGFIIPYALHRANYNLSNYGTFVFKRLLRLDPPYIVIIGLTIPIGYLSSMTPGFAGPAYHVSLGQVLLHFAYLNAFFHYTWLNDVFWTLAIEFQYYLLIGLMFPLVSSQKTWIHGLAMALLGIIALTFSPVQFKPFVFHWLFLFMAGILVFQRIVGLISSFHFIAGMALALVGAWMVLGLWPAAVGISTALIIFSISKCNWRPLLFLGEISYSLYLVHNLTGVKVVNLGARLLDGWISQLILLLLSLGISVGAAFILYRLVERPAQKWSSAIRYRRLSHVATANTTVE